MSETTITSRPTLKYAALLTEPYLSERGNWGASEHRLWRCGPDSGHSVRSVALCDNADVAALLLHVVNSHAALLAALKDLLKTSDAVLKGGGYIEELQAPAAAARAAIEQAEGR